MLWQLLRLLVSVSAPVFFKGYKVKNAHHFRTKGPVILAMNHPNAFMDPVIFALMAYPPKFYYLARGDAFKGKIARSLLNSLKVAPIFRMQDGGKEGLKKNEETYQYVNKLLKNGQKIMVFAEGICVQEKRLRPLKKGVARMVFGAMDEINDPDFIVVPIGINYEHPSKFRGTVFFNVGEPIRVADYMERYKENPARTYNTFLADLYPRMKELIVHINNPANDKLVTEIEELVKRDWIKQQGLNYKDVEDDHNVLDQIVKMVNATEEKNNDLLIEFREKSKNYFAELKKLKIRDWLLNPNNANKVNWTNLSFRVFLLVLFLPSFVRGLMGNYIPYKLSEKAGRKLAKTVEFLASFTFGTGIFIFLFWYIFQFFIAYALAPHIGWPFLVTMVSFASGAFALSYFSYKQKTFGLLRTLKNRSQIEKLKLQRIELLQLLAGFNKN
jgi:glycerol-3-phosphate O-acyltransferase/dihydroxyacetone phosphate acyltransferase